LRVPIPARPTARPGARYSRIRPVRWAGYDPRPVDGSILVLHRYDPRPVDGSILVLHRSDGKTLGIGAYRAGADVPPELLEAQTVLSRLDGQMRGDPACATLAP
jgi:hypothetical protein